MTGGVLFAVAGTRFFLPATIASKVLSMPGIARVPGAPDELVGVALVEGDMIPIVAVGEIERRGVRRAKRERTRVVDSRPMLLCVVHGERVGLVGLEILATGHFARGSDGHVVSDGKHVPTFDVDGVVRRLGEGRWAV